MRTVWKKITLAESDQTIVVEGNHRSIAGIMHKFSTAVPQSSTLTALCFLGLLGVLQEYACGARPASGYPSHALSSWRQRHFVTGLIKYPWRSTL